MRKLSVITLLLVSLQGFTQPLVETAATKTLTTTLTDGRLTLSTDGASYFANLSLACTDSIYPHYYWERLTKAEDLKPPEKLWPSFYGCYDWHSSVHNHWALLKLLKTYPNIPEAAAIKEKLEQSFKAENILVELQYVKTHQDDDFEFPYGTSWLLKVSEELLTWDNPLAKKWNKNLQPLTDYIVSKYMLEFPFISEANFTGNHFSTAFGLSFALDYARAANKASLEKVILTVSKKFYGSFEQEFPLAKEPFDYDFMSAGLLIADLMRKVLPADEYVKWLHNFAPDLFTTDGVAEVLKVQHLKKHTSYSSHFDGFHLNRIWCLNGILKSLPANALSEDVRKAWINAEKEMWDYAQESIGKGNYDIDHWLSSFSVFALEGYK
ncbi:DUF2891 family protein [Ferruginibacter albus]|uniref:DUF2891 family protein n=1 Tax=Ferruginibacter albus TaxID=2875540 RepID=UPI001CC4E421|nr:DUF2891 family protein [Ferruginibacter albus]UAY51100.1 DUF2891 domain-containing protein [Ferruginibacter albus]